MRTLLSLSLGFVALIGLGLAATQGPPPPPEPVPEHEWLQRLVGEWDVCFAPAFDSAAVSGSEQFSKLGELWVVSAGQADGLQSMMTLGYDPEQQAFVGSWIDSVQTHMWLYRGQLDEGGEALTLETEGPSFSGDAGDRLYRDRIEWIDADNRRMTSSVRMPDGSWAEIMTASARRKR